MRSALRLLVPIAGALWLASCAARPAALPPPPVHAKGQQLWEIVHGQCVLNQTAKGLPDPCTQVAIEHGEAQGYVVMKDRQGAFQYLVMPTSLISGIASLRLLAPDTTNYFAAAWGARHVMEQRFGAPLARDEIGVAVNSIYGRTQDLLHLHLDCMRADVRDTLRRELPHIGYRWSRRPIMLIGHGFRAVRIDGEDTLPVSPFRLLATGLHVNPADMGAWTIAITGTRFPDGRPGFVMLAARADPAAGFKASAGDLQDHSCAVHGTVPVG